MKQMILKYMDFQVLIGWNVNQSSILLKKKIKFYGLFCFLAIKSKLNKKIFKHSPLPQYKKKVRKGSTSERNVFVEKKTKQSFKLIQIFI